MTDQDEGQPAEQFHRDRREHGGIPGRLDDDQLARLTEEERVAAGLDAYDPDEVPPATDAPPEPDLSLDEDYQEEQAEFQRQEDGGQRDDGLGGVHQERQGFLEVQLDRVGVVREVADRQVLAQAQLVVAAPAG